MFQVSCPRRKCFSSTSHGPQLAGKWQMMLRDESYGPILKDRSNVDLKDKWRCLMGRTHVTVAASSALVELAKQAAPDDFFGPDCDFASSLHASEKMDDDRWATNLLF